MPQNSTIGADAWTGPVLDTPYTWNFYSDQSPIKLDYVARLAGVETQPLDQPFTYCELGCGNGMTSNVLAAAWPQGEFHAVDINPEHIANGRGIAERAGLSNVRFVGSGFSELMGLDLPGFDFITLHGVESWVSPEVRRDIRGVIDAFLKPGGLVYVSYDAVPGWASFLPLRRIMLDLTAEVAGGTAARAAAGLKHLAYLRDIGSSYFKNNPAAARLLDRMAGKPDNFVAHQFFNNTWEPRNFSDVAGEMAAIGLEFIGQTEISRNRRGGDVAEKFRPLLGDTPDQRARESIASFHSSEGFRRDVYWRSGERVAPAHRTRLFAGRIFGAKGLDGRIRRKPAHGDFAGRDDLLSAIAGGARTTAEIGALPEMQGHSAEAIVACIHGLAAAGELRPFATRTWPTGNEAPERYRIVSQLNRVLLKERLLTDSQCVLASPVLGDGVRIKMIPGLLLLVGEEVGLEKTPERALEMLADEPGRHWYRKGKEVSDADEGMRLMTDDHQVFRRTLLPILQRLGIVEAIQ